MSVSTLSMVVPNCSSDGSRGAVTTLFGGCLMRFNWNRIARGANHAVGAKQGHAATRITRQDRDKRVVEQVRVLLNGAIAKRAIAYCAYSMIYNRNKAQGRRERAACAPAYGIKSAQNQNPEAEADPPPVTPVQICG